MIFHKTKLSGLYVLDPEVKKDERGDFARIFCKEEFAKAGIEFAIVQANQSLTKNRGTIRGLHFQKEPRSENKIVQCLKGKVFDVSIDLRKNSKTYGQWVAQELSEKNRKMFFIPKGFAHGFQTLVENCKVQYLMSEFYDSKLSSGARFNDKFLNITWPIKNPILSEKDKNWPSIK